MTDFVDRNNPTREEMARACGLDPAAVRAHAAKADSEKRALASLSDEDARKMQTTGMTAVQYVAAMAKANAETAARAMLTPDERALCATTGKAATDVIAARPSVRGAPSSPSLGKQTVAAAAPQREDGYVHALGIMMGPPGDADE